MNKATFFPHERLVKLYDLLDTEKGTLAIVTALRGLTCCALVFYYWVSFEGNPTDPANWRFISGLTIFSLYVLFCSWLNWSRSDLLILQPALYAQVLADVTFYTFFYTLSGTPRSDVYLLYLLPLFTAVRFLGINHGVGGCLVVALCFNTVLFTLRDKVETLDNLKLTRLLLARNFILGGFTFFLAFRRRFSVPDAVRRQDAQLRNAFNASTAGICVVDAQRKILSVNDVLRQRHGEYTKGQTCSLYFGCTPQIDCGWCALSAATAGTQPALESRTHLFRDAASQAYHAAISAIPMLDDSGTAAGAIALVTDVSIQTRQIQQLATDLGESTGQVRDLTRARAKWLDTYNDLGKRLAGLADLEELLHFVVNETQVRLGAEASSLFLLDPQRKLLVRRATAGVESHWLADERYPLSEGIVGRTLTPVGDQKYGQPLRLIDVAQDPQVDRTMLSHYQAKLASGRVQSLITVPLNGQTGSFGVLRVLNKLEATGTLAQTGFTQEDEDFLVTIASMIAIAIENTQLLTEATGYLREIKAVHDASHAAISTSQVRDILHTIVTLAGRVSGSDLTGVVLVSRGGALTP